MILRDLYQGENKANLFVRSAACREMEFEKTNPICRPSAGNPKLEALNPKRRHLSESG
jgi:hypothetical protein